MFSLSYFPHDGLPWRISWKHTPMLYLEHAHDAAATIANLAMGDYYAQPATQYEARQDVALALAPTFLELCTGKIYLARPTLEGDHYELAQVARPGR